MFSGGRSRVVAGLAGLALVALALAGCGGGGSKPVSLPSLSPASSSPTPSTTSSQIDLDAISAVVRRYFTLVNGPTSEAAAGEMFSIMTSSCSCRRAARSLRDAAKLHETFFGTATVTSLVPNLDGAGSADVLVDYDFTRGGLKDSMGRVLHSSGPRRNVSLDFRLLWRNGSWRINDVQIVSNGSAA